MICLDPYYRTIRGLLILIEQEFLSFGHRFHTRCGHPAPIESRGPQGDDQRSPIFIQWLDCVYQLWHQHPCAFEFDASLLTCLAEHVYSCQFGTFLLDSHKEREDFHISRRTPSLWRHILDRTDSFANPFYNPAYSATGDDAQHTTAGDGVGVGLGEPLRIHASLPCMRVWGQYWFRYHPLHEFYEHRSLQYMYHDARRSITTRIMTRVGPSRHVS